MDVFSGVEDAAYRQWGYCDRVAPQTDRVAYNSERVVKGNLRLHLLVTSDTLTSHRPTDDACALEEVVFATGVDSSSPQAAS